MSNKRDSGDKGLQITYVSITALKAAIYNPRKWSKEQLDALVESIRRFGAVDPLIVNAAPERTNNLIGGHMRLVAMKELGFTEVPVVYVNIPDEEKERELNLRLNRNTGEFDLNLLAEFDPLLLSGVGFTSEELDDIFPADENPEVFDLAKELKKLEITNIDIKHGDRFDFGADVGIVMNGDSTNQVDMLALMDGEKADMCMTDPPYLLDYLKGKKKTGKSKEGFGLKRDRTYLGTDTLPPDFTEKWMANVAAVAKPDFSIMIFENPKNLRTIWNEMEKHWRYRNTITWHLPNRTQGFSAKYKFFNKADIALLGTGEKFVGLNLVPEGDELLQSEYQNALYATSGKPQWESYEKGKKICPTDFIEFKAADEKSSGQGIIFGTKPTEILVPYIKVLTKRGDLVIEPFGGSGSTAAAAFKLKRRFRLMEKSNVYTAVILKRLEKLTGIIPKKV
jgi:DNA modification methylase